MNHTEAKTIVVMVLTGLPALLLLVPPGVGHGLLALFILVFSIVAGPALAVWLLYLNGPVRKFPRLLTLSFVACGVSFFINLMVYRYNFQFSGDESHFRTIGDLVYLHIHGLQFILCTIAFGTLRVFQKRNCFNAIALQSGEIKKDRTLLWGFVFVVLLAIAFIGWDLRDIFIE